MKTQLTRTAGLLALAALLAALIASPGTAQDDNQPPSLEKTGSQILTRTESFKPSENTTHSTTKRPPVGTATEKANTNGLCYVRSSDVIDRTRLFPIVNPGDMSDEAYACK